MVGTRSVSGEWYEFIDLVILLRSIVSCGSFPPTWSSPGLAITASSTSPSTSPWTLWITICTHGKDGFFRNVDDEWDTRVLSVVFHSFEDYVGRIKYPLILPTPTPTPTRSMNSLSSSIANICLQLHTLQFLGKDS